MIVGDSKCFAIESEILQTYANRSLLALGFFVIIIESRIYGVREPDATMLGCSYDKVVKRIHNRGRHSVSIATESASMIADAFRNEWYIPSKLPSDDVCKLNTKDFNEKQIVWAPDGDTAFDDESYVLHFDYEQEVRLIAFKAGHDGLHDPATLVDKWLNADVFYGVLEEWKRQFDLDLASKSAQRVPE